MLIFLGQISRFRALWDSIMCPPAATPHRQRPTRGKYSFPASQRDEIFQHVIREIRKRSDRTVALSKEDPVVWEAAGLNPSRCDCVCRLA
mgnify:CR=1 FL=1